MGNQGTGGAGGALRSRWSEAASVRTADAIRGPRRARHLQLVTPVVPIDPRAVAAVDDGDDSERTLVRLPRPPLVARDVDAATYVPASTFVREDPRLATTVRVPPAQNTAFTRPVQGFVAGLALGLALLGVFVVGANGGVQRTRSWVSKSVNGGAVGAGVYPVTTAVSRSDVGAMLRVSPPVPPAATEASSMCAPPAELIASDDERPSVPVVDVTTLPKAHATPRSGSTMAAHAPSTRKAQPVRPAAAEGEEEEPKPSSEPVAERTAPTPTSDAPRAATDSEATADPSSAAAAAALESTLGFTGE
jgi:hypothetical protein